MNDSSTIAINTDLDLVLERVVAVPPELVWQAWTQPEHVKRWFCPAPWTVTDCRIDLRPGGIFHTTMRSPDGEAFPGDGCYLEIQENRKLVWTSALLPGYRPAPESDSLVFTAAIVLAPEGKGTRYKAIAMHRDRAGRQQHEQMGFHDGWSICLDQLVAYMKSATEGR